MLNFSEITQINIPEGEAIKVEINAITVWEKPTVWDYIITPLDGFTLWNINLSNFRKIKH